MTPASREFVLTDIHGCYQTFRYVLEEMMSPTPSDMIYLLGDYINKGPGSRQTLDYIFQLQERGYQLKCLMGNHEKYLLDALDDPSLFYTFINKGGDRTLQNFGVDKIKDIPEKYLAFIRELDFYFETSDAILVHAGFDFSKSDPFADKDSMLNIRDMKVDPNKTGGKKIIHGHVPTRLKDILTAISDPSGRDIYLDGGCVYAGRRGLGFLVGLELSSWKVYVKECMDQTS